MLKQGTAKKAGLIQLEDGSAGLMVFDDHLLFAWKKMYLCDTPNLS